eukprot:2771312-Rhodomonas_salina.2
MPLKGVFLSRRLFLLSQPRACVSVCVSPSLCVHVPACTILRRRCGEVCGCSAEREWGSALESKPWTLNPGP